MATIKETVEEALRMMDEGTQALMKGHALISQAKTILKANI